MVRFLLYANEFDVEGLLAVSSRHQRTGVQPDQIRKRIDAYGEVLPNLRAQAQGYPDAQYLLDRVKAGSSENWDGGRWGGQGHRGLRAWIIAVVDKPDPRPIYLSLWGGAVDLAQALWTVRNTRSEAETAAFVKKLRVYSISDQDNAGGWIRRYFPDLLLDRQHPRPSSLQPRDLGRHVRRPVLLFRRPGFQFGVAREWVREYFRKGPIGALYPLPNSSWKAIRLASSIWSPTAWARPSIPTMAAGAVGTARCRNGMGCGPTPAILSSTRRASLTRTTRPRSGAGAKLSERFRRPHPVDAAGVVQGREPQSQPRAERCRRPRASGIDRPVRTAGRAGRDRAGPTPTTTT